MKIQKINWGGGGGREGVGVGLRGQGGCDRRIVVFVKIHTKKKLGGGGGRGGWVGSGGGGSGWWGGGQGCERRIEVFVKIKKKYIFWWGGGLGGWVGGGESSWGVRVDVNEELKLWKKFTKKNRGGVSGGEGVRWGVGLVGGSGWM